MTDIQALYRLFLKHPNVVTDSRKIVADCLFFALRGEKFNGNQYAKEALEKGAAYAVIDEVEYQANERYILVAEVLTTLQSLAHHHRSQFSIPVIGITGSNGKTTTKELLYAVLSSHYPTHCTQGNFNNHIGVPLTLLAMPQDTEVAIIEMGANHIGEIDFLCGIAAPTHGLITNIGKAHLEGFGGIEGVKKGKSELYRYLQSTNGSAFVNTDEPFLEELSEGLTKRIFYHQSESPNSSYAPFETIITQTHPFVKTAFLNEAKKLLEVNSQLPGIYNYHNIATAVSVGRYFKVPSQKIKAAIENYLPTNNRSQVVEKGSNTFLLDAYNANPTSMAQSLVNFSKMKAQTKVAILGDMLELGNYSQAEHQKIYDLAQSLAFEKLILVGTEFQKLSLTGEVLQFKDVKTLRNWFDSQQFQQTHVLLKGSRGIQLEQLLKSDS